MKKAYIAPAVVSNNVTIKLNLLTESFDPQGNLNSVTFDPDPDKGGDDQMVRQENIWNAEW